MRPARRCSAPPIRVNACSAASTANNPAAAQIVRLAATLPSAGPPRLERLRGFGLGFGRALTCACSRLVVADGKAAVLIVATEPAGPALSLAERVRRLFGDDEPLAAFAADGALVHVTEAARAQLGGANSLSALGIQAAAAKALDVGNATALLQLGQKNLEANLQRLGEERRACCCSACRSSKRRLPKRRM